MRGVLEETETAREQEIPEECRGLKVVYPEIGSPYYINPATGHITFISPPGTPPVTSEQVREWLRDFP